MSECPNCERYKESAKNWRHKAYELSGHPLPWDRGDTWVGLTDDEAEEVERWVEFKEEGSGRIPTGKLIRYIEAKLKEKNHD
jgi:hypothetical protein